MNERVAPRGTQGDAAAGRDVERLIERRFERSASVSERFFAENRDAVARACWRIAHRFHQGGRLLAFGSGAQATDAQHVSVEFVHPVIVGKRALPALALTNDSALLSGLQRGGEGGAFVQALEMLARPSDIALGFTAAPPAAEIGGALARAKALGLLAIACTGEEADDLARLGLDFCFRVPSDDPYVVQETHETLYHVLWELVHVYFEHEGLLE